jgi:hypothetical protein
MLVIHYRDSASSVHLRMPSLLLLSIPSYLWIHEGERGVEPKATQYQLISLKEKVLMQVEINQHKDHLSYLHAHSTSYLLHTQTYSSQLSLKIILSKSPSLAFLSSAALQKHFACKAESSEGHALALLKHCKSCFLMHLFLDFSLWFLLLFLFWSF